MDNEDQPTWSEWLESIRGSRIWIGGHNAEARRAIEPQLVHCIRPPTGPLDAAFICAATVDEAVYFATKLSGRIVRDRHLWIVLRAASEEAERDFAEVLPRLSGLGFSGGTIAPILGAYVGVCLTSGMSDTV